jgi:hypothetical protein
MLPKDSIQSETFIFLILHHQQTNKENHEKQNVFTYTIKHQLTQPRLHQAPLNTLFP